MSKIFKLHRDPVFADFAHSATVVAPRLRADRPRHRRVLVPVHLQDSRCLGAALAPGLLLLPVRAGATRRRRVAGRDRGDADRTAACTCCPDRRPSPCTPTSRPPAGGELRLLRDRRPRHDGVGAAADGAWRPAWSSTATSCTARRTTSPTASAPPWCTTTLLRARSTTARSTSRASTTGCRRGDGRPTADGGTGSRRREGSVALKFDAMLPAQPLRQAADLGRRASEVGLSGLVVTEAGRTAYLTCGALAVAADIDVLTGIAVAFPRSPMVTAATAWELAEASRRPVPPGTGRAGAGAHRAALRLRLRPAGPAVARVRPGRQADLRVLPHRCAAGRARASSTTLSLLPPSWAPGAIDFPDPPIDVAAVNPWMLRMVGGGGRRCPRAPAQPPTYLRETVLPEPGATAPPARDVGVDDLEMIVPAFLCVGDTEEEHRLAGEGADPDRLLRVDAQLRLHLRTTGPRGDDRADP